MASRASGWRRTGRPSGASLPLAVTVGGGLAVRSGDTREDLEPTFQIEIRLNQANISPH